MEWLRALEQVPTQYLGEEVGPPGALLTLLLGGLGPKLGAVPMGSWGALAGPGANWGGLAGPGARDMEPGGRWVA